MTPKASPTIAGKTVKLPPKQKATRPTQAMKKMPFVGIKPSVKTQAVVNAIVIKRTVKRPMWSDKLPKTRRPAVLNKATRATTLAASAMLMPATC